MKNLTAAVLVIVVMTAAAVGGAWLIGLHATQQASKNAVTITQLCQAGNQARAQQILLWDHLVAVAPKPPSESVQARTARLRTATDFLKFVDQVFAARNCAHPSQTEAP